MSRGPGGRGAAHIGRNGGKAVGSAAVAADWEAAQARTEEERIHLLRTSDLLELHLRRLAAFVYERRTGDSRGAMQILAHRPPGSQADIAPEWLHSDASNFTKLEYQRDGYVWNRWPGSSRGSGDGGRGRGRGAASASATPLTPAAGPDTAGGGERGRGGGRSGRGRRRS